jgi:oligoendopeptidase F
MADKTLKERSLLSDQFKWCLEDIYPSDAEWEKEFSQTKIDLQEAAKCRGTLAQSGEVLFDALEKIYEVQLKGERLFVYSRMRLDEDNSNSTYQGLSDRATALMVEAESILSFVEPEMLKISDGKMASFFENCEKLSKYRHMIDVLLHQKEHILPDEMEKLLAMSGEVASAPRNIFTMLNNADMKFPVIKDEDGADVELTHGNYIPNMESTDRNVRKAAFTAMYETYKSYENTIAATLSSSIKKDVFYSKARKYESALHAGLHSDNVSVDVYKNLISAIHEALPSMYKYMEIKRKKLGVEKLHMYDIYTPIFEAEGMKVTYEQSKDMVLEALKPLGSEYISALKTGLDSGKWVDVYENKGKTSGAYSWGVWGTHPYVLLNWNDTINNAFTLAHELGHAMHSHFSDTSRTYVDAQYPILLAEVASTCNEAIFMQYMLKNTKDKAQRLYLLNYFLEQFRTTMFRQVMFAEFEMITHEMHESGQALTAQTLKAEYRKLNELYYGNDMEIDELIDMEWARIPHFYRAFYVYKYATGFASAVALSNMVLTGGEAEQTRYLDFLKAGGSKFPLETLKDAGVDLTQPDTVAGALKTFTKLVEEMEAEL